jgi:hypothetical protein
MGAFSNCEDLILYKIQKNVRASEIIYDLQIIFNCFEAIYNYNEIADFLEMIMPKVEKIGRDVMTDYIKGKMKFYRKYSY